MGSCSRAAITTLDHQAFCLNHFLLRCYEKLEGFDPRGRKFSAEPVDLVSMRGFIEECSRKALDVSLQSENLATFSADDCSIFCSGQVNCSSYCAPHGFRLSNP